MKVNKEAISERSKKEVLKALKLFKWNYAQKLILTAISKEGIVNRNYKALSEIMGQSCGVDSDANYDIWLYFDPKFSNGRRLWRKKDIQLVTI